MINHFDAQRVYSDRDLVKSMVQNLHCISYAGAKGIYESLADRAGNKSPPPLKVEPAAVAEVLKLLPKLPATPKGGEYRYRASSETIRAAWALLDTSTAATVARISAQP